MELAKTRNPVNATSGQFKNNEFALLHTFKILP
jgi:hypothetical protein